jgi:hypothetical protein
MSSYFRRLHRYYKTRPKSNDIHHIFQKSIINDFFLILYIFVHFVNCKHENMLRDTTEKTFTVVMYGNAHIQNIREVFADYVGKTRHISNIINNADIIKIGGY